LRSELQAVLQGHISETLDDDKPNDAHPKKGKGRKKRGKLPVVDEVNLPPVSEADASIPSSEAETLVTSDGEGLSGKSILVSLLKMLSLVWHAGANKDVEMSELENLRSTTPSSMNVDDDVEDEEGTGTSHSSVPYRTSLTTSLQSPR